MRLGEMILQTLKEEVIPAIGCTEPVAVALACAKAKDLLDFNKIKSAQILVSPNIYKNGLSVGIPNTEEVGLHISAALGLTKGKSENGLRVLEEVNNENVINAKKLLNSGKIILEIKDTSDKIYIEVNLCTDKGNSRVIIKQKHNKFTYIEKCGEILLNIKEDNKDLKNNNILYGLKIREIIKEIEKMKCKDILFMLDGLEMNEKIAQVGLNNKVGMGVGYCFQENMKKGILSDDLMNNAMMMTAAASDARMSGINMPVMSSNGSGNNGLTAILPIVAYSNKFSIDDERLSKALAISHIINSYIKHYIGRLSALCACGVAAGTGAGVAIAWLMGGNEDILDGVIKNMLANISGIICDGAKVGCALKLATSASVGIQSALLAMSNSIVPSGNGIVAETAEDTIKNLGVLSYEAMDKADNVILNIMKDMQTKTREKSNYKGSVKSLNKESITA